MNGKRVQFQKSVKTCNEKLTKQPKKNIRTWNLVGMILDNFVIIFGHFFKLVFQAVFLRSLFLDILGNSFRCLFMFLYDWIPNSDTIMFFLGSRVVGHFCSQLKKQCKTFSLDCIVSVLVNHDLDLVLIFLPSSQSTFGKFLIF